MNSKLSSKEEEIEKLREIEKLALMMEARTTI